MNFEFRIVEKKAVKDKIKSVILDIDCRKDLHLQLRDLRKENYVLEYEKVK